MIGVTGFTALIAGIWASAFVFGALVVYWFLHQGFAEEGVIAGTDFPLEDRTTTRNSLLIWLGFFAVLGLLILLGG